MVDLKKIIEYQRDFDENMDGVGVVLQVKKRLNIYSIV